MRGVQTPHQVVENPEAHQGSGLNVGQLLAERPRPTCQLTRHSPTGSVTAQSCNPDPAGPARTILSTSVYFSWHRLVTVISLND